MQRTKETSFTELHPIISEIAKILEPIIQAHHSSRSKPSTYSFMLTPPTKQKEQKKQVGATEESKIADEKRNAAAQTIQTRFRNAKRKHIMAKDPWITYLKMMPVDQIKLSYFMLGASQSSPQDPVPHWNMRDMRPPTSSAPTYHRIAEFKPSEGYLMDLFEITEEDRKTDYFVPVMSFKNAPIGEILKGGIRHYHPFLTFDTLMSHRNVQRINLVKFSQKNPNPSGPHKFQTALSATGCIATPWEIAKASTKANTLDRFTAYLTSDRRTPVHKDMPDPSLPKTKEDFLQSIIFAKLFTSTMNCNSKNTTRNLAKCLKNLVEDFLELKSVPELFESAIPRIAMMIRMANDFFRNNYTDYSFCVYLVAHEITLILDKTDREEKRRLYEKFKETMKRTFGNLFFDEEDERKWDDKIKIVSSPAISGSHALTILMRLVKRITDNSMELAIIQPSYYEIEKTTTASISWFKKYQVFLISAGPMIEHGMRAGTDINLFVKNNMISKKISKPVILIVDGTTALYKTLRLNQDTQSLMLSGELSIGFWESRQKFGLAHTDQAQFGDLIFFGRVPEEIIQEFEANAFEDYCSSIDMQIGAFFRSACERPLEEGIKAQHFLNGSQLHRIFIESKFTSGGIRVTPNSLTNFDELYFIPVEKESGIAQQLEELVPHRDSFGHYMLTQAKSPPNIYRLSPGASAGFDDLIEATKILLDKKCKISTLMESITPSLLKNIGSLSVEEQIISIALIDNLLTLCSKEGRRFFYFLIIEILLKQCPLLQGSIYDARARTFLRNYRKDLVTHLDDQEFASETKRAQAKTIYIQTLRTLYVCASATKGSHRQLLALRESLNNPLTPDVILVINLLGNWLENHQTSFASSMDEIRYILKTPELIDVFVKVARSQRDQSIAPIEGQEYLREYISIVLRTPYDSPSEIKERYAALTANYESRLKDSTSRQSLVKTGVFSGSSRLVAEASQSSTCLSDQVSL